MDDFLKMKKEERTMDTLQSYLEELTREEAPALDRHKNLNEEEAILERIKSLLNWLTRCNFKTIKNQLIESILRFPSLGVLQGLVSFIFEMALADEEFVMYGHLCSKLNQRLPPCLSSDPLVKETTFKKLLIRNIQIEFENALCQSHPEVVNELEHTRKLRLLCSVRLSAEMFKHEMMPERICHHIIEVLWDPPECPPDINIEAICRFLSTAGILLDSNDRSRKLLNEYFTRLKDLLKNLDLSRRSRIMILNLLELQANDWEESDYQHIRKELDKAIVEVEYLEEETRRERLGRLAAIQMAEVVKRKYKNELKHGKEIEEQLEKMKQVLEDYDNKSKTI